MNVKKTKSSKKIVLKISMSMTDSPSFSRREKLEALRRITGLGV